MNMVIYRIKNLVNNKVYIGQSIGNGMSRKHSHFQPNPNKVKNQHLYASMELYGREKFEFRVICECLSQSELDFLEQAFILYYDSSDPLKGYNHTLGGNGKGKVTDRTREKLSRAAKGRSPSQETREKLRQASLGRTRTQEQRERYRQAAILRSQNPQYREKLRQSKLDHNPFKGHHHTLDSKLKIGSASRERKAWLKDGIHIARK